jgi:hypothetical protein
MAHVAVALEVGETHKRTVSPYKHVYVLYIWRRMSEIAHVAVALEGIVDHQPSVLPPPHLWRSCKIRYAYTVRI